MYCNNDHHRNAKEKKDGDFRKYKITFYRNTGYFLAGVRSRVETSGLNCN